MRSYMFWLLFLQIIQPISSSFSLPGGGKDRLSLLAFKAQITGDPLGALSSWNESLHFCEWSGVTCGRRHQRAVELDLHSCKLAGSLSSHIGNLSFLRILDLSNNSFSQNIPQELGRLFRLLQLNLENNTFTGEIPANISHCSNLQLIDLQRNDLIGKIPAELGSLLNLQACLLAVNHLVGEIPLSFENLSSVERISVGVNHLQGNLPYGIGRLKRLKILSAPLNNLSGTIPPSMYNLSSLTLFSVASNQFHGSLPSDLGQKLPSLEVLVFYANKFNGPIPVTIFNASTLSFIDLGNNSFTGKVPPFPNLPNLQYLGIDSNDLGNGEEGDLIFLHSLANCTDLEVLGMSDNNLGGMFPEIISNFSSKFTLLSMARNQMRGSIPVDIGNLISLDSLTLEKNQLTGVIPTSIGKLKNLHRLALDENKISGNIPSSLGNVTSLLELYLSANNLQGGIPSNLANCQNLIHLELAHNNLSGPLTKEVIGIASLSVSLDLSHNQLMGPLPSEVGRLVNLGYLDVSHNRLSGEIPGSLGSCIMLENLHLEGNFFQGSIPELLSSLRALQYLNLSYNNLTGQIPRFFADFQLLQHLDLSFNHLEGEMPTQRVFGNASAVSVLGNDQLCGGISQLNLSRCTSNESRKAKFSTKLKLVISIPCGFIIALFLISSLLIYSWRKAKSQPASGASWEVSFRRVTYEELYRAAAGFSPSSLIGRGSFGSVYKAILEPDGMIVAVKVFNLLRKGASKSYMAECAALINIRHRNLVKILTACSSLDFQGNDFKALVYEFLVNGSLEEWLHPVHTSDEIRERGNLNLIQRLNIAIDVASALDYLHCHCQMAVVHCDLKPSNVLLDGDMTAHVGDFGLARFRPEASVQLSSNQDSSIGLKGTVGYAAPEYGIGNEVSTSGDVYSYGILLLEMLTGKMPTDGSFKEGLNLHKYVNMALPDHVMEVVDPVLLREVEETSSTASDRMRGIGNDKAMECLVSIMEVGVSCSEEVPRERTNISHAVAELLRIRDILLGTRRHGQRT
ncbi:LRR receptor serine/threonine-protein kinase [Salix suchowensis]|nr:LRR receptor serine/threonine-protein kinase [Salix suchowensis]